MKVNGSSNNLLMIRAYADWLRSTYERGQEAEQTCMGGPAHQHRGWPYVYHDANEACPICDVERENGVPEHWIVSKVKA